MGTEDSVSAALAGIDPRDFALWIMGVGGEHPDIGGRWYRYCEGADRHVTHFDDLDRPDPHLRRRANVSVYPSGAWSVIVSHGPDQIRRSGRAADCIEGLRAGLGIRARWLAGEHCGAAGCRYCG
jgi:hypothetical protein